ncbi:hypothetical protein AMS68_004185 [Peltaster fructicola]|uniref:GPI ethanolamine phosphate transferase 2 n=1 Tax=Peltaster fructicola TaxID=286661 RepID=A0A6H0XVN3_9PEZI|nr:hypothetical protein AMS68_004185 [Peltaster fructicola]
MVSSLLLRCISLLLSNILLPVAVLTFASGFFPYKPVLPGLATFEDGAVEREGRAGAPFDKLIFLVVDALRSDFVYGYDTGFKYTQSLIRSGAAIPFTAHATPPTVTMPRVKALTTGSVPSFLDLILNFAESDTSSSLATQDTWLAQLRARSNSKLVFYGDDTWLKLFPGDFFARSDGTSSFFVSDFTEVDHNVTRHVPEELARDDWNVMIMHYLGMDHIGHKTGPQGPNMLPKQEEMDGIVKMIFEALKTERHHERTLLVLAGDHGMNAGGNHGGSGPGETEPALLFVSPRLQSFSEVQQYECPTSPRPGTDFHFYTKMEQSDVVPTLAALLGFPIPKNSLGVCMPEMLGHWQARGQVALLDDNISQLSHIIRASFGEESFERARQSYKTASSCNDIAAEEYELACKLALSEHEQHPDAKLAAQYDFLYAAQEAMSSTASSYNIPRMSAGTALAAMSLTLGLLSFQSWIPSMGAGFLVLMTMLYSVMMFASSFVEEEQHFWYWMSPAWFALLTVRSITAAKDSSKKAKVAFSFAVLLALHRLAIRWNQTGQKHAGEPDIVHTVFPEHHLAMWVVILAAYAFVGFRIGTTSFEGLMSEELAATFAVVLIVPAIIFKLNFTQADAPELVKRLAEQVRQWSEPFSLVFQARVVFLLLAQAWALVALRLKISKHGYDLAGLMTRILPLLSLFLATQTRAPNIPLLLIMDVQASMLQVLFDSRGQQSTHASSRAVLVATSVLLLSHTTYFCFGGSNSISSLDLSNAYNGVAGYNIAAVGVLLFASNWSGPLWWAIAAVTRLLVEEPPRILQKQKAGRAWVEAERAKLHADAVAAVRKSKDIPTKEEIWLPYMATMTVFFAAGLVAVMAACTVLRTHLFIWTVFSPKYLYAMAWSIGWHVIVNGVIGGAIWLMS